MFETKVDRRQFLTLGAVGGGAVFMSGLFPHVEASAAAAAEEFYFVQLSDCHWGYKGEANPDAANTLKKAVATVNALPTAPDFVFFTGDLTNVTDDPEERRQRMTEFRDIVRGLNVKTVRFIPGEHDASLDRGVAFKEFFGPTYYAFDHRGVHFIALDNVSDPGARIGEEQLDWLRKDLATQRKDARLVVLTHRPLFDLAPQWDWATRDGDKVLHLLMPYSNVAVFYGHIHQEHHHQTGHIAHHAAKSLIFPLPAPGSQEKRTPLAWDPAAPNKGLGWREIEVAPKPAQVKMTEFPVTRS
ncbi:MAG TPA: metallophosphoesterase [Telluria sp.]|nr:metallophosphoesterase [Telluria sp.]